MPQLSEQQALHQIVLLIQPAGGSSDRSKQKKQVATSSLGVGDGGVDLSVPRHLAHLLLLLAMLC
jgi:hypothetical protein